MDALSNIPVFTLTVAQLHDFMMEVVKEALQSIQPQAKETERLYSRKEACSILKISLPTLSRYMELGIIKGHKVGNRILIHPEDISNALQDIPSKLSKRDDE